MMDRQGHLEICKSKRWYETYQEANAAIEELKKKFGTEQHKYHCPFCRLYHITTTLYSKNESLELWRVELEYQEKVKREKGK